MLSPHSIKRAKPAWRFQVGYHSNDDKRRRFNYGHCLAGLLLMKLGSWLLDLSHNVGHAGLVAHESR
eukprot:Gb_35743 [translate_table: standard]